MKKIVLMLFIVVTTITMAMAQNDTSFYVSPSLDAQTLSVCLNKHTQAKVYPMDCSSFFWDIWGMGTSTDNPLVLNGGINVFYSITYYGCGNTISFVVRFIEPNVPNETYQEIWIHGGELAELKAVADDSASMYNFHWNTGEDENTIYKPAGTYIAGISDLCATSYRTKVVKESPEPTASCDLISGFNMLEWPTSSEQATYVQSLNIYYDYDENCNLTELVANVPYLAGSFVDSTHNSYQYPCQYHVVPIMENGEECPMRSYWVRTISLSDLMGTQGTQTLQWTSYVTEKDYKNGTRSVLAYKIFDVVGGEPSLRATVGSFANTYNYNPDDFQGFAGVAAVLDNEGKDGETLAFSRTQFKIGDPDNVNENEQTNVTIIYPNPSNGQFTVEGAQDLTIVNVFGQIVSTSHSDSGIHHISLRVAPGTYFVKNGASTQRVVVIP